ncbi:hypothetical protein [Streptomyces beihaiensis]|uniref:Uncharacterized protein n=1 Tax=Streptomyces beihaiensis TaxID=2984495 RepID=A0ABT3U3K0_9ACTN|nr:hypothetical protein [Streptomyces beihaiensis]MCX3063892.1 hypothetical protein [Streptomyces beihaiensis]
MTDGFMGPPWQMDWRFDARAAFEALPGHVREIVQAARVELVTAKDPYFRGIETDACLPDGTQVMPVRSGDPKGPHLLLFDDEHGWLKYTFVPRIADPQIIVEELFWQ